MPTATGAANSSRLYFWSRGDLEGSSVVIGPIATNRLSHRVRRTNAGGTHWRTYSQLLNLSHIPGENISTVYFKIQVPSELGIRHGQVVSSYRNMWQFRMPLMNSLVLSYPSFRIFQHSPEIPSHSRPAPLRTIQVSWDSRSCQTTSANPARPIQPSAAPAASSAAALRPRTVP